MTLKELTQSN